jgi:hypothetical protein
MNLSRACVLYGGGLQESPDAQQSQSLSAVTTVERKTCWRGRWARTGLLQQRLPGVATAAAWINAGYCVPHGFFIPAILEPRSHPVVFHGIMFVTSANDIPLDAGTGPHCGTDVR